ncbi:MAG: Rrf2 family transcriptional regulator [bacterium]|nr:Rrf2 family transcriptional regulator [bacterium]
MRLTLGRKGDYAVRAVLDLARHWGQGRRKSREIATTMDIPERYVGQILAKLVRADLLMATAGPDGGYSLSRDPAEVTLLEVVEASEGAIALSACVLSGGPCDWTNVCPVHETWSLAQGAFMDQLSTTTYADLAVIDAGIESGAYKPPAAAPLHVNPTARKGQR